MPCDLYLATDISALDTIAKTFLEQIKNVKLSQAYKAAEKVYQCIDSDTEDEEKTYIHLSRYLLMLHYIYKTETDQVFLKLRYDTIREKFTQRYLDLKVNLIERYKIFTDPPVPEIIPEKEIIPIPIEIETNVFGMDKYITSQQLYEAKYLRDLILIMDVRSANQFENSHLKEFNVINIDDALVQPGLSAHKLGQALPNDIREIYNKRGDFDYIILMDLDTTQDRYNSSKLRVLFSSLTEWDFNTAYKRSPYVLKGGYMDFIDRYPTYSTNPNVILQYKNESLDELLDLDIIQYPEEVANVIEDEDRWKAEMLQMYNDLMDVTQELYLLEVETLDKQMKFYHPANIGVKSVIGLDLSEINSAKLALNKKKRIMNSKLQSLLEKCPTDIIEKKAEIRDLEYKIVSISREVRKLMESHRIVIEEPQIPSASSTGTNTTASEGIGDIASARIPSEVPRPEVPTINRSTKPKTFRSKSENLGLVGLVNIRNTCYMNSVMQCFRHLPSLKEYFLSGRYLKEITKENPSLINECGDLVRKLWTSTSKSINPVDFYKKAVALHPSFKRGNHEDANEFFMFLYERMFEDTAIPMPRDRYAEPKYQTMYDRIQHRNSFFVTEFYHQIRTDCVCGGCSKKCLKYDIENVLMMGVPATGALSIEDLYEDFMHTCDISDYHCRNCERQGDIFREFSYQPKVITFMLKRYTYGRGIAEKITAPCEFPIDNFRMGRAVYKLWGACLHQGRVDAGHYTAVCLNQIDGNWYEYNDECVRPVSITSRTIKEKIYMLFYESEDGSEVGFSE